VNRLVLFDLDGTLVDSSPGIHASVRVAAAAVVVATPAEVLTVLAENRLTGRPS
jgi:phosphoglycolate phosphatase